MSVSTHYKQILQIVQDKVISCGRRLEEVEIIAVSKDHSLKEIQSAYQDGARQFGESRVQEALLKIPCLPEDCKWHLIGTLQSNKVSKTISSFQLIHSVDSLQLAQKISHFSERKNAITSILLQVNTSGELTKHGLTGEEWQKSLESLNELPNISIEGLMTIAPLTDNQKEIRSCFRKLFLLREQWRSQIKNPSSFVHLSMGMSHDYLIAIEEGATLLRIGTAIFGERSIN